MGCPRQGRLFVELQDFASTGCYYSLSFKTKDEHVPSLLTCIAILDMIVHDIGVPHCDCRFCVSRPPLSCGGVLEISCSAAAAATSANISSGVWLGLGVCIATDRSTRNFIKIKESTAISIAKRNIAKIQASDCFRHYFRGMILPYSTQFTCPVKENGFSSSSLLSAVSASSHCKRNRFEVTSLRYDCFASVKIASSKRNAMRSRRNVKAFGLVDKLGKKIWREEEESDSDSEDEVKKDTSSKRGDEKAGLDDPEERREWRKKIREVIDKHPDIEEEEIDLVEKRRKMQKLLADYPLVVNEEDPNWPEDADGWGFSFNQFFNKITIKNEKKDDDDDDEDDDGEKEVVWQDDNYIRPIKDLTTAEWEEAVFKDISPLMVFVHNRYKRPKENERFREEIEKAVQVIWNCGLPSPRCVAVDAVVETDLVSALKVSAFPEIIFTKAGKILYREKGTRTADELSKIMAYFYYGAAKPPCLNGIDSSQEQIPSVDVSVD
ncbi:unnamed protein product [Microthlaspi erraticum]|uniref:Thioredoxin domain-containing protein n=1 Tax=Microthlaspi erraticum TaxID=1685480 RepID=A0A6D2K1M7_9BRAS|nr:unnamed protein product [Microthlaspi erraticum]